MENPATHNLLVVSDVHMAEGLNAEAGERCHKYDAFLYDSSFSRFLQYHEQIKRNAVERLNPPNKGQVADQPPDSEERKRDELLSLPWRLVLNGDVIDFWDMADPPGGFKELIVEIDRLIHQLRGNDQYEQAFNWLMGWKELLDEDYEYVRILKKLKEAFAEDDENGKILEKLKKKLADVDKKERILEKLKQVGAEDDEYEMILSEIKEMFAENFKYVRILRDIKEVFAEDSKNGMLLKEIKGVVAEHDKNRWIKNRLENKDLINRPYPEIRSELDELKIEDGALRRSIENLAWWIEVLIHKPNFELSKSELKHGLGTTWREVVWKLTQVYCGHREFYTAIAWFIACGNEVILLKGNHDLELYWPEVHNGQFPYILVDAYRDLLSGCQAGQRLNIFSSESQSKEELQENFKGYLPDFTSGDLAQASNPENRFIYKEWFHLEEGLVYIEHGNQYEPLDSSVYFLWPKLPSDPKKIELPWGGLMARYIYNKIVAVHPFAVNVKPEEKIVHWMISNDFFRFLGIIVTALPDVIRGLERGIRQGLRGRWIWGDRSLLGLIPRFAYDSIQIIYPTVCDEDQEAENKEISKIDDIASSFATASENNNTGDTEVTQENSEHSGSGDTPPRTEAFIGCLLHLGVIGIVILLFIAGISWLSARNSPSFIIPVLLCFSFVTLLGAVWGGIIIKDHDPVSILGELLIQLGGVGILVGLALCIFLSSPLGWDNLKQILAFAVPISFLAVGSLMVKYRPPKNEHRKVYIDWVEEIIHSSSSLLKELSLVSFIASVFLFLKPRAALGGMPWLLTSLFLFAAGWCVNRLHTIYTSRYHIGRHTIQWVETIKRKVRIFATIVIVGLIVALLVNTIAVLTMILLGSLPQYEIVVGTAQNIADFFTSSVFKQIYLPRLVILLAVIGGIMVFETIVNWILCKVKRRIVQRLQTATKNQANQQEFERRVFKEQLSAIQYLAKNEQRRFATSIWKVLNFLLPLLSVIVLVTAIIGFGAAIGAVFNIGDNIDLVGGLSIGSISGFSFWILRQISASFQKHDPSSGFGDLYYRMATQLSYIFSDPRWSQGGMGCPRYFIFGHDHWADCEMIEDPSQLQTGKTSDRKSCWYVNSGTWLRGYVEEQRRQEVNENHSTFVQIIPGLDVDQTPRVLRWNDALNQPERIIRRSKPSSAGHKLANQWRQASYRWIIWGIVLIVISLIIGWINPDLMGNLFPILWAFLLWLIINSVKPTIDWIRSWDEYCQKKKQARNLEKPSP